MVNNTFMRVEDVAAELGISKSYAYKIVQKMNAELKSMGYLTIAGRVNRKYFMEKVCYDAAIKEKGCETNGSLQGCQNQHMARDFPLYRLDG